MKYRNLTIAAIFLLSVVIGRKMFPITETVQAQTVQPSFTKLPEVFDIPKIETEPIDTISVDIDLATMGISVKGTSDAVVLVNTTNSPEPITVYKTKVIEKEVSNGYPYVKAIGDKPIEMPKVSFAEMAEKN